VTTLAAQRSSDLTHDSKATIVLQFKQVKRITFQIFHVT